MVLLNRALLLAAMSAIVNAASLPKAEVMAVIPSRDLETRVATSGIVSEVSLSALQPRADNAVIFAVLTQSTAVAAAACTLGNPWVCAGGVAYAVMVGFFSLFVTRNGKRDVGAVFSPHPDFVPTIGCNIACQIAAKTPENVWTHIGSGVVDGVLHDYHHFRSGRVSGIRAYQGGYAAAVKRSDEDNDGGFVGDYYWDNTNTAAYDSFDSTDEMKHSIANDMVNFMEPLDALEICLDFEDTNGIMNEGVFAMGWNNQAFQYSSTSAIDARLTKCQYGQILHDGETEQEDGVSKL